MKIILNKSNKSAKYSIVYYTTHRGNITYVDDKCAIVNNKIIILDKETLIIGSFNFTKAAQENNAEKCW
ncbi:MAG: phospholipase D-like domain-containing protein [Smithellaceae bacterium]